ncbi:MAG TPA: hypothetical protein VM536_12430 [Chloroflexia bacterium]|nr:hypothetical protein [Chloroflexia bacterium]
MSSRRRVLAGLGCAILVFASAACQPMATATVPPTVAVENTASITDTGVWARIPWCACLDGTATKNVSLALERAELANTLKVLNPSEGWLYFVVAFDPETVSRDEIATAIVAGGGEVLAGPP